MVTYEPTIKKSTILNSLINNSRLIEFINNTIEHNSNDNGKNNFDINRIVFN